MVMSKDIDWKLDEWRTYQKIAAGIHAVADDVRVEIEYDYPVHAGGTKEIDVVVWDDSQRYERVTLIECKFWDNPVDKSVVDSVTGYLDNSDADKGVIIAKSGFQSGAKERARGTGIELWKLKKLVPEEDLRDNELRYVNMVMQPTFKDVNVTNMDIELIDEADEDSEEEEIKMTFTRQNGQLYNLNRRHIGNNLLEILTNRLNKKPPGTYTEEFEDRALLIRGNFYRLDSITYEVTATEAEEEYQMDLLEEYDLLFRNELTGEREYLSIEEAAGAFLENVST